MTVALPAMCLAAAMGAVVACSGASARETAPMVTVGPDDFVLRDVRKDAARYLNCQVPMIGVEQGPWAGSEGNVVASGCGLQVTYYLRCQTNHLCSFSVSE